MMKKKTVWILSIVVFLIFPLSFCFWYFYIFDIYTFSSSLYKVMGAVGLSLIISALFLLLSFFSDKGS